MVAQSARARPPLPPQAGPVEPDDDGRNHARVDARGVRITARVAAVAAPLVRVSHLVVVVGGLGTAVSCVYGATMEDYETLSRATDDEIVARINAEAKQVGARAWDFWLRNLDRHRGGALRRAHGTSDGRRSQTDGGESRGGGCRYRLGCFGPSRHVAPAAGAVAVGNRVGGARPPRHPA